MSDRQWYIVDFLRYVKQPAVEQDMFDYNPHNGTVKQLKAAAKRLHKRGYIRWVERNGRTGWMRLPWKEDPVPYQHYEGMRDVADVLKDVRSQ